MNIVQPQVQAWTGPKALRSAPKGAGRVLLRQPKVCRVGRRSRIVSGLLALGPPRAAYRISLTLELYILNPPLKNKTRRVI